MKKTVQSYLTFTTMSCRILLMIVVPIVAVAAPFLLGRLMGSPMLTEYYLLGACIAGEILLFSEVMLDNWSFGGITAKDGGLPICLNTSKGGGLFIKQAILVNMARQIGTQVLVLVCLRVLYCQRTGEPFGSIDGLLSCAAMALLGYFFTILGVTVARFFMALMVQLVIVSGIAVLYALSTYIFIFGMVPAIIIVLVCVIVISGVSVKIIMKKQEDSYRD